MTEQRPRARRDDLLIEEVLDEVLIYDTRSQQAHCLNATAAAIWRACDGLTTVAGLAAVAGAATGQAWSESVVCHTLETLRERDLLVVEPGTSWSPLSRRELMERVGASLLLPLITSLSVPTPAMAQSGGPPGSQGPQGPQGSQG